MLNENFQVVIDEKSQIDSKIDELNSFMESSFYDMASFQEQINLKRQYIAMRDYSNVLKDRINSFNIDICHGSQTVS